jgi:Ca-activated chloride channel homolog
MTFGSPHWLWALALLPALLAIFAWNQQSTARLLHKIVAPRLAERLAGSVSVARRWLRLLLQLAGMACVVVSLAQPRFGYTWEQSKHKGRDVIVAIDVSKSMLATDVSPNRLTRAKLAAQDLVGLLQGDRVGLIAFAGSAFLQAPLTADYGAVLDSINELDTNIIPLGGTNIAEAITLASDAFGKGESENRCLIIFSDGEEIEADAVEAARKEADNFRVFTVGVGTKDGSLIPLPGEQGGTTFVQDENGQFVKSRLDDERLGKLADAGGGFYVHLENGPADMKKIVHEGLQKLGEREFEAQMSRRPIERYQWPLAAGLLLLASSLVVSERRRAAARRAGLLARGAAVACFVLCAMPPGRAFARNAGVELYEQKKYGEAFDSFQKQLERNRSSAALNFNLGAAAFKKGDYDKALESFGKALPTRETELRGKAEYNLGNTLCQRGVAQQAKDTKLKDLRGALEHYDEAVKIDPKNEDAKFNRDVVKKLIEELEKEKPPQQEQKKDQQQQKQEQEKQEQQKKENQEQQKQEQQKQQNQQQQSAQNQQQSQQQQNPSSSKDQGQQAQTGGSSKKKQNEQRENRQQASSKQQPGETKQGQAGKQDRLQFGQGSRDQQSQPQQQPSPENAPPPSEKKFSGEIHAETPTEAQGQQTEQADAVPVEEGKMSKAQALSLVESAKGEDARVNLTERARSGRVVKDW